jgi:conjugative relaxase-like TrwC/TraI family protein
MLSIGNISSAKGAAKYYTRADYYSKEEPNVDIKSSWYGKGAESLGLSGEVDMEMFSKLLQGNLPNGENLGRMLGGEFVHKPGWDLTFGAPKSVSLLVLLGGDKALLESHHLAVKEALDYIEKHVLVSQTMTDEGHAFIDVPNALIGQFTHSTNREQEPHLHTHNVVMNAASTNDEQWRSVYSRPIYNNKMLAGLVYKSKLAELSKELGYTPNWDNEKGTFELNEVSPEILRANSQRRINIENYADKHGLETPEEMAEATMKTRSPKKDIPTKDVVENWERVANEQGIDFEKIVSEKIKLRNDKFEIDKVSESDFSDNNKFSTENSESNTSKVNTKDALKDAYNQLMLARDILAHHEQAFTNTELLEKALSYSKGNFTVEDLLIAKNRMIEEKHLLPSAAKDEMFTTKEAVNRELNILDNIERGKNKFSPFADEKNISLIEDAMTFSESQSKSFGDIVRSNDKYIGLQGFAGTGKTYLTKPISEVSKSEGYTVRGMAPNGRQAETLGNELEINAQTVKSFLVQAENNDIKLSGKQLWIVDESTLLNAKDTESLVKIANQNKNVRVLFVGDGKQLGSIEAGRMFGTMMKGGMSHTTNNDIQRQQDKDYLGAVQAFTRGEIKDAFVKLEKFTHEIPDEHNRFISFADEYMDHFDKTGKIPLAVIPNKNGETTLAGIIRDRMRDRGIIKGADKEIKSLIPAKVDGPQKSHAQFYSEGMIVKFNKKFEGLPLAKGEYFKIGSIKGETMQMEVHDESGNMKRSFEFNPSKYKLKESDLTAYKEKPIKIAEGDKIVWKDKNSKDKILNGYEGTIKSIEGKDMVVDFGKKGERKLNIDKEESKHFQHNYSQTAFSAQGATSNKNMMMAESWRRNLVTQPAMYVGVSRGKFELSVYTDNKKKLEQGVIQRNGKNSEGVEHVTSYQAKQLREPEKQHRTFFDAIGLGSKDKFKTFDHADVFHQQKPLEHAHTEKEHKSSVSHKPQHEKSR